MDDHPRCDLQNQISRVIPKVSRENRSQPPVKSENIKGLQNTVPHETAGSSREFNCTICEDIESEKEHIKPTSSFCERVPDFMQLDWNIYRPIQKEPALQKPGRKRINKNYAMVAAITQQVCKQRSGRIIVPDVLFGQLVWGGERHKWPKNWRQSLVKTLEKFADKEMIEHATILEKEERNAECPPQCALFGRNLRHSHFQITLTTNDEDHPQDKCFGTILGWLDIFGYGGAGENRRYLWNPKRFHADPEVFVERWELEDAQREEEEQKEFIKTIRRLKKNGSLASVYFPILLFGSTRGMDLTINQQKIHRGITHELTRNKSKSTTDRIDKAEILIGGQVSQTEWSIASSLCPFLKRGVRYVGFNGNGSGKKKRKYHGRGYSLWSWMTRVGYALSDDAETRWQCVQRFFKDLDHLCHRFGFIVAGWHPRNHDWLSFGCMKNLLRSSQGRRWLASCRIRIYTEADYLHRWRQLFAERSGFSIIPGLDREENIESGPTDSRNNFLEFIRVNKVTQKALAKQLEVSPSLVSKYLTGKRTWSEKWSNKLKVWLENWSNVGIKVDL